MFSVVEFGDGLVEGVQAESNNAMVTREIGILVINKLVFIFLAFFRFASSKQANRF